MQSAWGAGLPYDARPMDVALSQLLQRLHAGAPAVLVTVHAVQGSGPREPGAWMAVWNQSSLGSVGGGHLEWMALQQARRSLQAGDATLGYRQRYALGPQLGQCCGGSVELEFVQVDARHVPTLRQRLASGRQPVAVFGAGHVGLALVTVLRNLPVFVHWIDSRDDAFAPSWTAATLSEDPAVLCETSDPPTLALPGLPARSQVLIMTHSHALDLALVQACLLRQRLQADLAFIGLIGSRSKWASFQTRLRAQGFSEAELSRVRCPLGIAGVHDKRPAVLAVAIAAQLLQQSSAA